MNGNDPMQGGVPHARRAATFESGLKFLVIIRLEGSLAVLSKFCRSTMSSIAHGGDKDMVVAIQNFPR
jgi:hypothetical protein